MCSGVVNVIVLPLTDATCLISFVARSVLENHDIPAGGAPGGGADGSPAAFDASLPSWYCCWGQCMFQATRSPCQTLAAPGKPVGVGCHDAPDSSSSRTNWPAANPDAFATVTVVPPLAASADRFCDPVE